jgi:hypothetical protein
MNLQKASRKKAKIKLCLQGPSGSGKTYSALLKKHEKNIRELLINDNFKRLFQFLTKF